MIFEIVQEWALCREALLPAIELTHGTHTEDDVLVSLIKGDMKLWRLDETALVTEFNQFPRMKVINVFLGGGSLDKAKILRDQVKTYALKNGCQRLTMLGRQVWVRALGNGTEAGTYMYEDI